MRARSGPGELLAQARALEPGLRLSERNATLAELAELLATDGVPDHARWSLELDAERAIDLARDNEIVAAESLARAVLAATDEGVAAARARQALGSALAWTGTDGATRAAERVLIEAARQFGELAEHDLQGATLFWLGNSVHLQNGRLEAAERCMRQALDVLPPDSARRPSMLTFLSDVYISLGRWSTAEEVLDEAADLAAAIDDPKSRAYVAWSRARMASARGDAAGTERYVRETERDATDWFDMNTGVTFLADAAELLDRVGERAAADRYLQRALERDPSDEFVRQARAIVLARRGNPSEALDALQDLTRGVWLEKRVQWRHTLFAAYATLRAGRSGAGELAGRALDQAVAAGGVLVASSTEPETTAALLPLAEGVGSAPARLLLCGAEGFTVRLFGSSRVARGAKELRLPPGQAAELFRAVAVAPHGRSVGEVLELFFPEVEPSAGRHRLRQLLTRLRSATGDTLVRDGEQLLLAPAWVDLHAFQAASRRALTAGGATGAELAHAALALWTGPPLPADPYAGWASATREQLRRRYLALLDLVAGVARERRSFDEALHVLTVAREEDPYDESRYVAMAEILLETGRRGAALHVARDASAMLADLAVPLPASLRALLE
ncbi:MAG TPA: BTAD domain-containing putative transcriptional regulator [Jatrophihabitantaceae bacterium]|jgi:DNA-binding SARP family transcriptional activator|nr:BTAD domain-containing putative transcriptional regulator [Jatrophihabitantaceae bacterium]